MLISFSFQHYTGEAEASRRGLGGVDRLLQIQEVLHCIDFKFCFLCFVVFFFFFKLKNMVLTDNGEC